MMILKESLEKKWMNSLDKKASTKGEEEEMCHEWNTKAKGNWESSHCQQKKRERDDERRKKCKCLLTFFTFNLEPQEFTAFLFTIYFESKTNREIKESCADDG